MERIYFDKQIFSGLFKGVEPKYQKLLIDLKNGMDKFLYCYSHAHILDLKNDKTDIKFQELKFMEELVKDNYICHYWGNEITTCHLTTPTEAFAENVESDADNMSLTNVLEDLDLDPIEPEKREELMKAKELLLTQKLDFGLSIPELPEELKPLAHLLPIGTGPMTIQELMNYSMKVLQSMEEDKSVYKGVRSIVDQHINNGKFVIEYDSIDFNDDMKNSVLKKKFTEYVNDNLNPQGDKKIHEFDFYNSAYFSLDLLGISKEPSSKVKFRNVLNDALHSYYGSLCDHVVSDDQGFIKKSTALYRLLGIPTRVHHIDEFISQFHMMSSHTEQSSEGFFDLLENDIKGGLVTIKKAVIAARKDITKIKPMHHYLSYFNRINIVEGEGDYFVYLDRTSTNNSRFYFGRELAGITNKAVKLFGSDHTFNGEYNWPEENDVERAQDWKGRHWRFSDASIDLEVNSTTNSLCLIITLHDDNLFKRSW